MFQTLTGQPYHQNIKSPVTDTFCDFVCDNFLSQLVSHPTRSDNILDLLLTTNPNLISSVSVTDSLPCCNHDAVPFMLSTSLPQQSTAKCMSYYYKAANINNFKEVLYCVSWDVIDFENDDIELGCIHSLDWTTGPTHFWVLHMLWLV